MTLLSFDAEFYLANNQDVKALSDAGLLTALDHYLLFGDAEGRDPNAFFDVSIYRGNPEVRVLIENNLIQTTLGRKLINGVSVHRVL